MIGDLMGKMKEAQQKIEEAKARLSETILVGQSKQKEVRVFIDGNRKISKIVFSDDLFPFDSKEKIETYVLEAVQHALILAENVHESEMKKAAMQALPKIPGLF